MEVVAREGMEAVTEAGIQVEAMEEVTVAGVMEAGMEAGMASGTANRAADSAADSAADTARIEIAGADRIAEAPAGVASGRAPARAGASRALGAQTTCRGRSARVGRRTPRRHAPTEAARPPRARASRCT